MFLTETHGRFFRVEGLVRRIGSDTACPNCVSSDRLRAEQWFIAQKYSL